MNTSSFPSSVVPVDRAIRRRLVAESLETHPDLNSNEIGYATGLISSLQLSDERFARLLSLIHRDLLTGFRARFFNILLDRAIQNGQRDEILRLTSQPEDVYWELSYGDLTPTEKEVVEQTWLSDQRLLLTLLLNGSSLIGVCSGPLCQEVCFSEFNQVPFEHPRLPSRVFIRFPNLPQRGENGYSSRGESVACLPFPQLIEALANNYNPYTGGSFPPELSERYALDLKLRRATHQLLSRLNQGQ